MLMGQQQQHFNTRKCVFSFSFFHIKKNYGRAGFSVVLNIFYALVCGCGSTIYCLS